MSFGAGINAADLTLQKVGYDLLVKVGSTGDQLTLESWFSTNYTTKHIDEFRFADGTVLTGAALLDSRPVYGYGGTANDNFSGYEGVDIMGGGIGNDTLSSLAGTDTLAGGLGNDSLSGGLGNDTFLFDTALDAATNKDSISDFTSGQDKIALDKDIFSSLTDEGSLPSLSFLANATGIAGDDNDSIIYNTTSGALFYDADGSGSGAAVQFATLTSKPTIGANDFLVVA